MHQSHIVQSGEYGLAQLPGSVPWLRRNVSIKAIPETYAHSNRYNWTFRCTRQIPGRQTSAWTLGQRSLSASIPRLQGSDRLLSWNGAAKGEKAIYHLYRIPQCINISFTFATTWHWKTWRCDGRSCYYPYRHLFARFIAYLIPFCVLSGMLFSGMLF